MEGKYPVTYMGQAVGAAELKREGLYCRILCRCEDCGGMMRLYAGEEKLGLMMPSQGGVTLETKIPAKRIADGCAFTLRGKENFIPIRTGEPFAHLQRLKTAKLVTQDGRPGINL